MKVKYKNLVKGNVFLYEDKEWVVIESDIFFIARTLDNKLQLADCDQHRRTIEVELINYKLDENTLSDIITASV